MRDSFAEVWARFEGDVLPKEACEVQRTEMQKAFYSGAKVMLDRFMAIGEDEEISEEAGVEMLEADALELEAFFEKLCKEGD